MMAGGLWIHGGDNTAQLRQNKTNLWSAFRNELLWCFIFYFMRYTDAYVEGQNLHVKYINFYSNIILCKVRPSFC